MADTNRTTGRPNKPVRGDVTAMQVQALEEERDANAAQKAREDAHRREVEEYAKKHEVIDYSGADTPLPEPEPVENDEPLREFIAKYTVEDMAFGRIINSPAEFNENGECTKPADLGGIRYLNFEEGRRYRVPKSLYMHLDERGLIWH